MARMIPPYISRDVKSRGERMLFEVFKEAPNTDDWVVIHALGVAKHKRRIYGEIDFMVLAPKLGLFVLEVKSGRVKREQGVWKFINRYGDTSEKTRGPFDQAKEAMFSIKAAVRKRVGGASHLNKLLYGYGVMFPDIKFNTEGPDQEGWQIYDRESRKQPVSEYIRRLSKKTRLKVKDAIWYDAKESIPSKEDVVELVAILRGNFERRITPRQMADDMEEQLGEYTSEQYMVLDQLEGNPRCLFMGAAGTGKTMLALESARRSMLFGRRTLLVCRNRLLSEWLRAQLPHTARGGKGFIGDWGRLLARTKKSGIKPFAKLVIDEGQEVISPANLDILDSLLEGGLKEGEWDIFCDLEEQALVGGPSAEKIVSWLTARGASLTRFRLTMNCRNSGAIGKETARLAGLERAPSLPETAGGQPVEYHYYENEREQLRLLKQTLKRLRYEKIEPERITILSPRTFKESCAAGLNRKAYRLADPVANPSMLGAKRHVTFSTIDNYKGLENSYVIITDIEGPVDAKSRSMLYLGMSRAQAGLVLLIDAKARGEFEGLKKGKGKRGLWE